MELLERNDGKKLQIICNGLSGVNVKLLQRISKLEIDEWMAIEVKKEEDKAFYTCPNFITLAKRLEKPISKFDFYMIIGQIAKTEKILKQLELDMNDILWNVDSIYISPMTRELKFIYLPYDQKARNKTKDLLNDIIYSCTQSSLEDTYLTEFVYYLKKADAYNYNNLIDYIGKRETTVFTLLHLDDPAEYELPVEIETDIISIQKVIQKQTELSNPEEPEEQEEPKKQEKDWEIPMFFSSQNKPSAVEQKEVEVVYKPDDTVEIVENIEDEKEEAVVELPQEEFKTVEEVKEPVQEVENLPVEQVEEVEQMEEEPVEVVEQPEEIEKIEEPVVEEPEAEEAVEEPVVEVVEEPETKSADEEALDDLIEEVIIEKKKESKKKRWDFDILDFHFGKDRKSDDLQETVDFKLQDTQPKVEQPVEEKVEEAEPVKEPSVTATLTRVSTGDKVLIDQNVFVLGKSKNVNGYTIEGNPAVSRKHASIQRKEKAFFITDLESVNHVFINDNEIIPNKEYPIYNGDVIALGDEVFNFETN